MGCAFIYNESGSVIWKSLAHPLSRTQFVFAFMDKFQRKTEKGMGGKKEKKEERKKKKKKNEKRKMKRKKEKEKNDEKKKKRVENR